MLEKERKQNLQGTISVKNTSTGNEFVIQALGKKIL